MSLDNINNHRELKQELKRLKAERELRSALVVEHVNDIYELVAQPSKIIKRTASELAADKDFKSDVLKIVVNLASGFLTRKGSGSVVNVLLSFLIDKFSERKNSEGPGNIITQLVNLFSGRGTRQKKHKETES